MIGQRFGRLLVVDEVEPRLAPRKGGGTHRRRRFRCRCDCGADGVWPLSQLRCGMTQSCGCLRRETTRAARTTHGNKRNRKPSAEYNAWMAMRQRCGNPKTIGFKNYGGRGIRVCPEWQESFHAFLAHIGPKPTPIHSIDRIDNDGHYEPGNVRWATRKEQRANQRPPGGGAQPVAGLLSCVF